MNTLNFLIVTILLVSCATTNKHATENNIVNNNFSVKTQKTISGKFESKMGVMDKISCHGFNIGYIKSDSKSYVICFDRLANSSDLKIDCENIVLIGTVEEHEISGDENGVCKASKIEIFYVSEWKCL